MTNNSDFEWDDNKDKANQKKHGVSFALAQLAFFRSSSCYFKGDLKHSTDEERFFLSCAINKLMP